MGMLLDSDGKPQRGGAGMKCARFYFGSARLTAAYWLSGQLYNAVGPSQEAWLWLNNPDTWNRKGLHLATIMREAVGERRVVTQSPVHHFYYFEAEELNSLTTIALTSEWSFYLMTASDYGRVFVSQSSNAEFWSEHQRQIDQLVKALKEQEIEVAVE
jgi:hypothetical protein